MIRIAIFEDHTERREALKLLLSLQQDMVCTGAYESVLNLNDDLLESAPDVVLMDIDMPGMDGIEGVHFIHTHFPDLLVIMQTVFEDEERLFNSLQAGANGYILKKASPQKLIDAIRDVVEGGAPMTSSIAYKVLSQFRKQLPVNENTSHREVDHNLTIREIEILSLLVKGYSHKMVAAELFISAFTVSNHVKKIYQKLHVHSASEVVAKAIQHRIIK